jgi:hypothetical protein
VLEPQKSNTVDRYALFAHRVSHVFDVGAVRQEFEHQIGLPIPSGLNKLDYNHGIATRRLRKEFLENEWGAVANAI